MVLIYLNQQKLLNMLQKCENSDLGSSKCEIDLSEATEESS